jgi:glycerophosphoryl diester phosphodiesterase
MSRPLLLGHRGARAVRAIPENTLASFDRALADGCDGFEFDVRLTADGQAVVCHDPTFGGFEIARTAAPRLPTLPRRHNVVERYPRAFLDIELKAAGIERIVIEALRALPRLHDVVECYPKAFLDIELKVPGLEKIVIEALRGREDRRFVVSSFLPEALKTLHAADATIPLGLICETQAQLLPWNQLSVQYVIPHRSLVDQDLVRGIHGAGKQILVWTVDAAPEIRRFTAWGVDGIVSDDTGLLGRLKPELESIRPG